MWQYNRDREAVGETNARDWAEAAVLSQLFEDIRLYRVADHTWEFTEAKINYEIYDNEKLGKADALLIWTHSLEGTQIPMEM